MKTIYMAAGTEHVQFDELAHRIATALHPLGESATDSEMMAYGGACLNLEAELLQAAKSGALPVKDPLTFGPHSYPRGNALQTALVSVNDLRVFLAGRPIAIESVPEQAATPSPAPVGQAIETREQRQDRRLNACIEASLLMDTKAALLRLPAGVGDVANREGVTRQAFSADVKAALKRRESAKREGVTVHRA